MTPTTSSGSATVDIADVRFRHFRAPTTDGVGMAFGPLTHRSLVLIEIESAAGVVGYGESWVNYPSWAATERLATLAEGVAPLLRGHNAGHPVAIHDRLVQRLGPLGRQWGAPGPIMQAISGVDIALWDLRARSLAVSVTELLGGRTRSQVPVYASSLGPTDVEATAQRCVDLGFGCVKVKVGFGQEVDRANLRTCREVVGPDVTVVADANQAWTLAEALAACDMLQESDVSWIEEPLKGDRLEDIEAFASRSGMGVATGENIYGLDGFLPYLNSPHIAVYQPDVTKTGGLTETARICEAASSLGRLVMPHLYGGAVAFAATLQLAARFAVIDRVEYDVRSNPLRDPIMVAPLSLIDGMLTIPDGPGLGIELDQNALARHEVGAARASD
ncbi:MAG: mandelate racemase/muconate lactonizing enzyme family protein [Jatrophihabitans sp.]